MGMTKNPRQDGDGRIYQGAHIGPGRNTQRDEVCGGNEDGDSIELRLLLKF